MKQGFADTSAHARLPGLSVYDKTQEVLAYHQDATQEGRPLYLLLGGAAVATVSLALLGMLIYRTWLLHELSPGTAYYGISFLFAFYILGIFLFCYAYELYNMPRALRLTLVAAVISVVLLVLVLTSLAALAKLKSGAAALAGEGDDVTSGSLLQTIASFGGTTKEDTKARRHLGGYEPFITPDLKPFLINCASCGEVFTPMPPKAACPHCGLAAVTS